MADSSRKTSISPLLFYALSLPVRAFKNTANWTFVQFRENESLRSCARIYSVAFRSSFRKLLTIGNVWRDQISKRISRFVAIVIGVNKNIRESTFIDLFFFSKILENSNILDDWTIGRSLYFSFWISKKPIGTRRRFANLLTVLMKFSVEYFCTWRGSCVRYFVGIEESSQRSKIYRISFIQRSIQI